MQGTVGDLPHTETPTYQTPQGFSQLAFRARLRDTQVSKTIFSIGELLIIGFAHTTLGTHG